MRHIVLNLLVSFYQKLLSPALHLLVGSTAGCRYVPSCSQYFKEAVETYGWLKGGLFSFKRICRCHPWGGQGYDPVIEKKGEDK